MSIDINDIYCKHLLKFVPKYKNQNEIFSSYPHIVLNVTDTIHYNAIKNNDFSDYEKLLNTTNQPEHSLEIFKKLIETFDIQKIEKIKLIYNKEINKYIITDGVHRISIILFKKIFPDNKIPLKYLNIEYDSTTIENIKKKLSLTTANVHYNAWNNRTKYGYHSFNLNNINIVGQRNPKKRLKIIKEYVDFNDKIVLDFGCNSGGMLLHLFEIKKGIGYDFNNNCINAAKYINSILKYNNDLSFYVKDLNSLDFSEIKDIKIDIVFLLALGSWIKKWKELYTFAVNNSNLIIYETNNDKEAMQQLKLFEELKCDIKLISMSSTDDNTNNHGRKTYLIKC